MSEKILVPALGESVTEATVSKWLKNQGDKVNADEPVVELETDKVNVEVPAPTNGMLSKINVKEGQTVNVGSLLGEISESANLNKVQINEEKKYTPPPKKKITSVKKEYPTEVKESSTKNDSSMLTLLILLVSKFRTLSTLSIF